MIEGALRDVGREGSCKGGNELPGGLLNSAECGSLHHDLMSVPHVHLYAYNI